MKRICGGWWSLVAWMTGCGGQQSRIRAVPVEFQSLYTMFTLHCLSTGYRRDLPTPDAKREQVLWSNRGVVFAVKLELQGHDLHCGRGGVCTSKDSLLGAEASGELFFMGSRRISLQTNEA